MQMVGRVIVALLVVIIGVVGVAGYCAMLVPPLLKLESGQLYQESLDSVASRVACFLTSQNASDIRLSWLQLPAAAVGNQTVLSGWVQSQNRFGMCFADLGGGGAISALSTDDAAHYKHESTPCDIDPSVIGHLQTISMVMVRDVFYQLPPNANASCNWSPAYGAEEAQWQLRPGYNPGSANGAPDASANPAHRIHPDLGFALALVLFGLSGASRP